MINCIGEHGGTRVFKRLDDLRSIGLELEVDGKKLMVWMDVEVMFHIVHSFAGDAVPSRILNMAIRQKGLHVCEKKGVFFERFVETSL